MSASNGNLSLQERRALQPGAVVSWQSPRRLSEQVGTVDAVGESGRLQLCDGAVVGHDDYCRLVSGVPMVPTEPTVRGLDGDGAAPEGPAEGAGRPQDGAGDGGAAVEPSTGTPGATGQGQGPQATPAGASRRPRVRRRGGAPRVCADCGAALDESAKGWARYCPACRRKRQGQGPGREKANRELWLQAVQAVNALRATGQTTPQAVAAIAAADSAYGAIKFTVVNYRWWLLEFQRSGEIEAPSARREKPEEARVPGMCVGDPKAAAALSRDLEAARAEVAQLKVALRQTAEGARRQAPAAASGIEEIRRAYQAERAQVAELSEILRLEREARQALEARTGEADPVAAACAERMRLLHLGHGILQGLRAEAADLAEALQAVRRYPWAMRYLRRAEAASRATAGTVETGGVQ